MFRQSTWVLFSILAMVAQEALTTRRAFPSEQEQTWTTASAQ
jgi:hypothetical protein